MESTLDFNRPDKSHSSRIDVLRSTLNNFRSKVKKSSKNTEPEFLVKGKNFSTTSTNFRSTTNEGIALDKFFGGSFKIVNVNDTSNLKGFDSETKNIPDLIEDSEDERFRVGRNNFEINETDEDLCTESNIGSSVNVSRLGSRMNVSKFEEKKKISKGSFQYRRNDPKSIMYRTSYNTNFLQNEKSEHERSKLFENKIKVSQDEYFNYNRRNEKYRRVNKLSRDFSQNSRDVEDSFTDLKINSMLQSEKKQLSLPYSSTNTKGFFDYRRNSKEKSFYNTRLNIGSFRQIPKKNESRSILTVLEENSKVMRTKYGKKSLDGNRAIPSEASLINKYKEKFSLSDKEYEDWSSLVQIKPLYKPGQKRHERGNSIDERSSSMKELIPQ